MLASVRSTLTNRSLGLPQGTALPVAVAGCCSSGAVATPTLVRAPDQLISTFGNGPGVELAAFLLSFGIPVIFCRAGIATDSTAGSISDPSPSGADPMTAAASGTPRDAYNIKVKVTRAGATLAALTAAVRISIDGGLTYGPEVPVPSSGALVIGDTGVTITFTDTGSLELYVDNVYTCACTIPAWSTTTLGAALTALAGAGPTLAHDGVILAGDITATSFATVKTSHDALITAGKPRWFLCNSRDQTSGESVSTWLGVIQGASPGFAGLSADLITVTAGFCDIDSQAIGSIWRRPVSWPIAARLATKPVSEHPGKVRSGALAGIRAGSLHHDLATATLSVLDAQGFMGAQSLEGLDGYIATATTRAAAGSDFTSIMRQRVIVYAARVAMQRMVQEVNEERLLNDDGTLNGAEADAIDASVTSFMVNEIANPRATRRYCSDVAVAVIRTDDLSTTNRLRFRLRMTPLGYSTEISIDLGYTLRVRN